MSDKIPKYPGEECGLSKEEWELEQIVDKIRCVSTLEAIGVLNQSRVEFAKLHVKAALKAVKEKLKSRYMMDHGMREDILSAYPENLIQ